jgi:Cdc6-like AAA superfamily ATPase
VSLSGVVASALQGYNATILAYGQTGTGKTFTMEGYSTGTTTNGHAVNVEARGIIPRAIEQIFGHIQQYASPRLRFLVRASYLQIYNEIISDLLKPERNNLTIREDKVRDSSQHFQVNQAQMLPNVRVTAFIDQGSVFSDEGCLLKGLASGWCALPRKYTD